MRVLTVIQRYGTAVVGGAERSASELAQRLVDRGHVVEVLTTTATTYGDWLPGPAIGASVERGVTVHRLPVATRLERTVFEPLNQRVIGAAFQGRHVPMVVQREWLQALGPVMLGFDEWIDANIERFDVVCIHTLGYWHASATVSAVAGRRPVVLHPLAHEEPSLALPVFDAALLGADAFAFLTPEEAHLIEARCGRPGIGAVIGLGTDEAGQVSAETSAHVRARLGLGPTEPFVLCVGRVDRDKGVHRLAMDWEWTRQRGADLPALVVAGEVVHPLESSPGVRVVGPLAREELDAAMTDAIALVHPSPFESFGMVLTEAWARGTPTLVNAACDVLAGQCRRSGGGLAWHDLAELHEQVRVLEADPALRTRIGERGRLHVREHMRWDDVLDRYEALLVRATGSRRR